MEPKEQKKIGPRKYRIYQILIAMLLSVIVSVFVTAGNYIIPVLAIIAAFILMLTLRKNMKVRLTDERIEKISGKAAYATYMATVIIATTCGIVLMALRDRNIAFEPVSYALSFLSCGMMYLYAILYHYYNKRDETG